MVRDYELMYIARPDLDEEALQAAIDSVEQLVGSAGGSVVRTTSWGRRRLAYEVEHLRDGHYMLLHVRLDGARVADVERALAIHETVFRHLLVLRDAEAEVEAPPDVPAAAPEGEAEDGATSRQAAVAPASDDGDADEDDDDVPAAVLIDDEEEN